MAAPAPQGTPSANQSNTGGSPSSSAGSQTPGTMGANPSSSTGGMGNPTPPGGMPPGAAPMGIPQPAMAAAQPQGMPGMPMDPMIPPHVRAMMPRPYPNPQQMFQPIGLAAVMQMQMTQQQMSGQKSAAAPKKK